MDLSKQWMNAIAYLKVDVSKDPTPAAITASHEDSLVLRDLGNGLLVSYLIDEGNQFKYIHNRHLIAADIDEQKLHETAINNLYTLAKEHLQIQPYAKAPVFAVFMEGNFEASILLLDKVWDMSLAEYVGEEFVVALPARDVLAFGDSSSPEAIAELRAIIGRLETGDHLL